MDDTAADSSQLQLDEHEMRRRLLDMESSFVPEPSTIDLRAGAERGADDTLAVGVPKRESQRGGEQELRETGGGDEQQEHDEAHHDGRHESDDYARETEHDQSDAIPSTPPAPSDTSALESFSSSPTAAAANRTVSRAISSVSRQSRGSANGQSQGQEHPQEQIADDSSGRDGGGGGGDDDSVNGGTDTGPTDTEPTPRPPPDRSCLSQRSGSAHASSGRSTRQSPRRSPAPANQPAPTAAAGPEQPQQTQAPVGQIENHRHRRRPKFLTSRQSVHRFSASSITTDATSDGMGVDYALQSGGAAPMNAGPGGARLRPSRRRIELSRTTSLGSMASGLSGMSEDTFAGQGGGDDDDEGGKERGPSRSASDTSPRRKEADTENTPVTPKATQPSQKPGTAGGNSNGINAARGFAPTPAFVRSGKSLTLKEQSSTIDRLSKENFDLKMRIHFLGEALNKRSEEGVKEMISENVDLKSDKLRMQKDLQALRRQVRELERQLSERDEVRGRHAQDDGDADTVRESDDATVDEEEVAYLRERMEAYELEIERLRGESIARESEKRRLAELVRADGLPLGSSDVGSREERDMWKDMLDAETAARDAATVAREQAEDEARRMREENARLRTELLHSRVSPLSGGGGARSGSVTTIAVAELELLRQENAELRREVGAQTSMLTSRNREKERLYQEIEDLKLLLSRRGRRSSGAADSIFERSASRVGSGRRGGGGVASSSAVSGSAASEHDVTATTERETLEARNGELRDALAALKMDHQTLRMCLDEQRRQYDTLQAAYQDDMEAAEADVATLQAEREAALAAADERSAALEELKAEAQAEIDATGDELDARIDECAALAGRLRAAEADLAAVSAGLRQANDGIARLEEDAQARARQTDAVRRELEAANAEIETLEKSAADSAAKAQRLAVQQESSANEIAFLREEQETDKIRIGDLEGELRTASVALAAERDRARELDNRLADERHAHDAAAARDRSDHQRAASDLAREAASARDDARKQRRALAAAQADATAWRERLVELENDLRATLGEMSGTRSSLLASITGLQREVETTALSLERTRSALDDREALLRNRDGLLESAGLESRKLAQLLERERAAHRADKHSFNQALRSHQAAARAMASSSSRITELEKERSDERRRASGAEGQLRDMLAERNAMFLTIWKRLAALCGPDWVHAHSLINGNLPSTEVIGNLLFWPGFSKNLLLAVRHVETTLADFRSRLRTTERTFDRHVAAIDQAVVSRTRRIERLEEAARAIRAQQQAQMAPRLSHRASLGSGTTVAAAHAASGGANTSPEVSKLRGENRLLRAELNLLQSHSSHRAARQSQAGSGGSGTGSGSGSAHSAGGGGHGHPPFGRTSSEASSHSYNSASYMSTPRSSGPKTAPPAVPTPVNMQSAAAGGTGNGNTSNSNAARSTTSGGSGSTTLASPSPTAGRDRRSLTPDTALTSLPPTTAAPAPPVSAQPTSHVASVGSGGSGSGNLNLYQEHLRELERRLRAEREARLMDRNGARARLRASEAVNEELRAELERHYGAGGGIRGNNKQREREREKERDWWEQLGKQGQEQEQGAGSRQGHRDGQPVSGAGSRASTEYDTGTDEEGLTVEVEV